MLLWDASRKWSVVCAPPTRTRQTKQDQRLANLGSFMCVMAVLSANRATLQNERAAPRKRSALAYRVKKPGGYARQQLVFDAGIHKRPFAVGIAFIGVGRRAARAVTVTLARVVAARKKGGPRDSARSTAGRCICLPAAELGGDGHSHASQQGGARHDETTRGAMKQKKRSFPWGWVKKSCQATTSARAAQPSVAQPSVPPHPLHEATHGAAS